jgi:hypothetical protein
VTVYSNPHRHRAGRDREARARPHGPAPLSSSFAVAQSAVAWDSVRHSRAFPMTTVPTFDELMWPALKALKAMGGSGTNEELLNKIIELERVPPEVQAVEHTDHRQSRLGYNLAWAKTYLKKVGAIDNSRRGVWSITKDGEGLTEAEVRLVPARVRKQIAEEGLRRGSPELQDNAAELVAEGECESPELH